MAEYNDESVKRIENAIFGLRNMKNLQAVTEACIKVHGYESRVDVLYNDAMGDLIRNNKDNPVRIIVLKRFIRRLEILSPINAKMHQMSLNLSLLNIHNVSSIYSTSQ